MGGSSVKQWMWLVLGGAVAYLLLRPKCACAATGGTPSGGDIPVPGPTGIPVGTVPACMPCYNAKSAAYDACRKISVSDEDSRAVRTKCFEEADKAFLRCLDSCGGATSI
jgi:hypothetical protein